MEDLSPGRVGWEHFERAYFEKEIPDQEETKADLGFWFEDISAFPDQGDGLF